MFDSTDLKQVMRRWPSGVAVLTARGINAAHGMTVNSFTSVSIDPPLVTVTLANDTRTKAILDESGFFVINMLAEGQQELSDVFAGRIPDHENRFAGVKVITGQHGIPMLAEAAAHLECRVVHKYVMENSTLYVAAVMTAEKAPDVPPLVYFNRGYHRINL